MSIIRNKNNYWGILGLVSFFCVVVFLLLPFGYDIYFPPKGEIVAFALELNWEASDSSVMD